jgi:hypothetical protein
MRATRWRWTSTLALVQLVGLSAGSVMAQTNWDLGSRIGEWVPAHTGKRLRIGFEERVRYESRGGNGFVREADTFTALERTRVSLTFETTAVKATAMFQDARAPWYGSPAPGNLRDTADIQEGYLELFPNRKKGFSLLAGRAMLNYGEGRLIGSPQWGNTARTYDHARVSYSTAIGRIDALFASPVKVRTDSFNTPVLSDRLWGVYAALKRGDLYVLRHDNLGGFRVNMLGFRLLGPIAHGWKYSLEGIAQNGAIGPARHRAAAWHSAVSRRWTLRGKALDITPEYNFASGTRDPRDPSRHGTFDQFSPANHDKFGHQDIFGWRNIHNARALATYAATKTMAVNLMYNHVWLASACDSLYNSAGRAIARSASCSAGKHVGQGADLFVVYRRKPFQLGAGYGYFVPGEFVKRTTPGAGHSYAYVFHSYSF